MLQAGAPPQTPPASSPPEMARDDPSPSRRTGTTPPPASRRCARAHRRGVVPSPPSSPWSATRPRARASPTTRSPQPRARLPETARDCLRLECRPAGRAPQRVQDQGTCIPPLLPAVLRYAAPVVGNKFAPEPTSKPNDVCAVRRSRGGAAGRPARVRGMPGCSCGFRRLRGVDNVAAAHSKPYYGYGASRNPSRPPCDTPSSAAPTCVGVAPVVWPAGEAPSLAECERRCCAEPTCHSAPHAHTHPPARTHPPAEAAPHLHLHLHLAARSPQHGAPVAPLI